MSLLLLLSLSYACHDRQTGQVVTTTQEAATDKNAPYVEGNKKIVQWESEEIDLFIKRYGWNTTKTGTGLRIEILRAGEGDLFQEGDRVELQYKTFLLSGELVYSSGQDGVKEFTVGRSEEIAGLHEAVQMLRPGAKARLVIPSHLAYGVAGDGNRIIGRVPVAITIDTIILHSHN